MIDLSAGADLPSITKTITQQNINRYADASKDFNPIHIDPDFARKTPLGGTIAHGMLVLAYISQLMTEAFGNNWLTGGKMGVRFKSPARPGDTLTVSGKIDGIDRQDGAAVVACKVQCCNQKGEIIISENARVKITSNN